MCYFLKRISTKLILILEKRALHRQDHVPLFVKAKVLPLNILYCESVSDIMHHIDERNASIILLNLFSRTSNSYHYFTRSPTSQDFHVKKNLDLIHKRMRSLVLAQRYGTRCQIYSLKT